MAKKVPKIVREIKKFVPHEINYAFDRQLSFSQIQVYNDCPYRWKLQYVDKKKLFRSNIYTIFGSAMHDTIQNYLQVLYDTSKAKANEIDLEEYFEDRLREHFQKAYKENGDQHFTDATQMNEFYNDGVEILRYFKKKHLFSKRKTHLVGIELPLIQKTTPGSNNIFYKGYLDLVLYNENSGTFDIIDIKTSTRGWTKSMQTNEKKFQLLLYKKYFSQQFGVPLKDINITFYIVKRKIPDEDKCDFATMRRRIQEYTPVAADKGKNLMAAAQRFVQDFIDEVYTSSGKLKERNYICKCGACEILAS